MKPLLYSYIRFSTAEQAKGHSHTRQINYARKLAEERGLVLDESLTMRDLGLSGYHGDNVTKGALGGFLKLIEDGKVPVGSILLIESLDRLSRQGVTDCNSLVTQIISAGITVVTAMDNKEYNKELIDKNPLELFAMLMIFMRANEESETKRRRVIAALKDQCERWQSGERGFRIASGKAPKWVDWSETSEKDKNSDNDISQYVFKPREKAIMLRKVELYKLGYGGLKIAEMINEEFGSGTVHHTGANVYKEVKRRSLVGDFEITVDDTNYVLKGYFPPLISEDEFNLMIADSSKRGAIKHSQKFVGILSGIDIFKCASCGKSVGSHVIYRKQKIEDVKGSHKRYGCVEAKRNNGCQMKPTIQLDVIEKSVVRFCQDKVNLQRILLTGRDVNSSQVEKAQLKSRLNDTEAKIAKLTDVLIDLGEESPKAIAKKIKELEIEVEAIHVKLAENHNNQVKTENIYRDDVSERWLSITKNLNELDGDKRLGLRHLVRDTFKSIFLYSSPEKRQFTGGLDSLIEAELLGGVVENSFELTLEFHNGKKRLLRLDKHSGELIAGVDLR